MSNAQRDIQGSSLAELYAQHKAKNDLDDLLDAQQPGAEIKAFASGVAAGSVVPLLWGLVEVGAEVDNIRTATQMAELLKSKGMSSDAAHSAAAGAVRFLQDADEVEPDIRKKVMGATGGWKAGPHHFTSYDDGIETLSALAQTRGYSPEAARRAAQGSLERARPSWEPVPSRPSPRQAEAAFSEARRVAEAAGTSPKGFSLYRKALGRVLQNAVPGAVGLAIPAGIGAAMYVRNQKKLFKSLENDQFKTAAKKAKKAKKPKGPKLYPPDADIRGSVPQAPATAPVVVEKLAEYMLDELDAIASRRSSK